MEILMTLVNLIFGCHHRQLSRVFTIAGQTYRVCCGCGAKFNYSLATMAMQPRFGREPHSTSIIRLHLRPQTQPGEQSWL